MKPEEYNPKAREAFGNSLITIGVAIFKGIILLVTVVPLTAILKSVFDGSGDAISLFDQLATLSVGTKVLISGLLIGAFCMGHYFRKAGLKHLHEMESHS